ncbi:MAG: ATP-binding protein [Clostridia bacterium]|nr:ATP-binding protein [Clostridia bacterium]
MNNATLNTLLREYDKKKFNAEMNFEKEKNNFYKTHPELQILNDNLNSTALAISKAILNNDSDLTEKLKSNFEKLKLEKESLLSTLEIPLQAKEPLYECKVCKDTGYTISDDNKSVLCNCIKQKIFDIEFNKSNIGNLEKENFGTFDFSLYSDEINEEKFNSKISPKQNILAIKNLALNFINNFDNPNEKNLLFTGNTGLGKTFLSNCIAKEMLDRKKTVLYQTAPIMLDSIVDYRFGKSDLKQVYDNIINVDLLVIDDLGAESLNAMKLSELFNIINARLLFQNDIVKKTIISTNLNMRNLFETYSERIFSRLASYYNICRFFGDDIRLKEKLKK